MKPETTIKIIKDISDFISRGGEACSEWHVGVTADPEQHLFALLMIPRDSESYILRCAFDAATAWAIAKAFWNIECGKSPGSLERPEAAAVYVVAHRKDAVFAPLAGNGEATPRHPEVSVGS